MPPGTGPGQGAGRTLADEGAGATGARVAPGGARCCAGGDATAGAGTGARPADGMGAACAGGTRAWDDGTLCGIGCVSGSGPTGRPPAGAFSAEKADGETTVVRNGGFIAGSTTSDSGTRTTSVRVGTKRGGVLGGGVVMVIQFSAQDHGV